MKANKPLQNEAKAEGAKQPGLFFALKTPVQNGVRTGFQCSICLSVCVCNIRGFHRLRELYEANFYGSGRVWANAWQAFRPTPSRGVRGRWPAVDFVVCLECGSSVYFIFSMIGFAFSNSCTRPLAARVQRRLGEEATTASQSSHRELTPTDAHQVYHLLRSHVRGMASSLDR